MSKAAISRTCERTCSGGFEIVREDLFGGIRVSVGCSSEDALRQGVGGHGNVVVTTNASQVLTSQTLEPHRDLLVLADYPLSLSSC